MLEQISNAVTFYAMYVASKVGKTGLTVTLDVWEVQKDGTSTEIVTAGSATEVGDGLYRYVLASGSVDAEGEYIAVFKTADTSVDQQHIPALWAIQRAGVENLNATISSVLTTALTESYATDGSAATAAQLLYQIAAFLQERSVSGTTVTVKKLDGSTTAMTFTINDASSPTSITRAS